MPSGSSSSRSMAARRKPGEDAVRLDRMGQLDPLDPLQGGPEAGRHRVRLRGVSPPEVAAEQRLELGPGEAHLRGQLHQLLADELGALAETLTEEDDGLAEQQAVLGAAEGEQVDPGVGGQRPAARRPGPRRRWRSAPRRRAGAGRARGRRRRSPRPRPGCRRCPSSVELAIETTRGWEACSSPTRSQGKAASSSSGVSLPSVVSTVISFTPATFSGAPHSSTWRWAVAGQITACQGSRHGGDRDHVGAAAVEDGKGPGAGPEVLAEALLRGGGPAVGAVGGGVAVVGRRDRLEDLRVGAGVVVAGEAAAGAHGCSASRWPFIRPPSSEQRKAIASARCSAGVKVAIRLVRVGLAHLRGEDRVDDDDVGGRAGALEAVGEGQGPGLGRGLRRGVDRVVVGGVLGLLGGDEDEAAVIAGGQRVVEAAGRVLDGADQQVVEEVPVLQRLVVQRLAALPAADQVDEAVDLAEALDERLAPAAGGVGVEQVDDPPVPALLGDAGLGGDRVEALLGDVGGGDRRARRRRGGRRPPGRARRRRRRRRSPCPSSRRFGQLRPRLPAASPLASGRASSAGSSFGFSCE